MTQIFGSAADVGALGKFGLGRRERLLGALAIAAVATSLALAAWRVCSSISFAEPLQMQTSGAEYESLFAIWKASQGDPVYGSRTAAPYNAVVYNWLFYAGYGSIVGAAEHLLTLSDAWLPTVARLLTLAGAIVWWAAAAASVRAIRGIGTPSGAFAAPLPSILALGPLTGFWMITARPDIWAVACEASGALAFLVLARRGGPWAIVLPVFAAYLAWSFKQTNLALIAAVVLFLLWRGRFAAAAGATGLFGALVAATLAVGTPEYRAAVLFSGYPLEFLVERGFRNAINAGAKTVPIWLPALVLAVSLPWRWRAIAQTRDDATLFTGLGTAVAGGLAFATAFQTGASENYYFGAAHFGALLVAAVWFRAVGPANRLHRPVAAAAAVGLVIHTAAVGAVLLGIQGVVSVRSDHAATMRLVECLARYPRPLFVNSPSHALPWLAGGSEPFPLSFVYDRERRLGRPFERNGIGGLVGTGYFATLALAGQGEAERFDGGSLAGYRRTGELCSGFAMFERRAASPARSRPAP